MLTMSTDISSSFFALGFDFSFSELECDIQHDASVRNHPKWHGLRKIKVPISAGQL